MHKTIYLKDMRPYQYLGRKLINI